MDRNTELLRTLCEQERTEIMFTRCDDVVGLR